MNNKDIKVEEKKVLFRNDEYTIFADGYIDTKVPLTNICYELALFLQRKEDELDAIYNRVYKIKDSQLEEPVNNMEKEDLTIDELLDNIEESFKIDETSINNARSQNKQLREALEKIALDIVKYDEIQQEKPLDALNLQILENNNLARKIVAINGIAQQALKGE